MSTVNEPVRIAFCITDLDAGGAERALVQLVTRLDRARWEPHVFCLSGPGELVDVLRAAKIPVECLEAKRWWNVSVVWKLARRLARVRPALLQTFLFHANIAGRIAAKGAGVRRVVSGIRVAERRRRWPLLLDRLTDRMVDRHVCVSEGVAKFSIERGRLPANKVSLIPNGVDADLFRTAAPADLAEFGIPAGSTTVLFVGRLDPQKGPFLLLNAAQGLLSAHGNLHVLFVGDGPLRKDLETWVAERNLRERIHFAGRRNDVANLMRAGTCLALPSRWEGMPNVVLEAMAAGLPVVAAEVEGMNELILQHETGLLVPPDSVPEFSGALALLLSNPRQGRAMGAAAQEFVAKEFTWGRIVADYEQLYLELLAR